MATVLDPDGDPILDPDGLEITTADITAPTVTGGHITVHGGVLTGPITTGRYDPFDRETVNPPPFGGTYTGASNWEMTVEQQLRSLGGSTLIYDTGHRDQDIAVDLLDVPTGFPYGAGIIFRWETANRYAWVQVWQDTNEDDELVYMAQPWARDDTNPTTGYTNGGVWFLPAPTGRLRVVVTGPVGQGATPVPSIDVYWDGELLGTTTTTIDAGHGWSDLLAGKAGLYADIEGSLFDNLHLVDPSATVLEGGQIVVHGGELSVPAGPPVLAGGHVTAHGGDLAVPGTVVLDTGWITVTGGQIFVGLLPIPAGSVKAHGGVLRPPALLTGQSGVAALPIGGAPDSSPGDFISLVDENGNVFVDQDGNVLTFA